MNEFGDSAGIECKLIRPVDVFEFLAKVSGAVSSEITFSFRP